MRGALLALVWLSAMGCRQPRQLEVVPEPDGQRVEQVETRPVRQDIYEQILAIALANQQALRLRLEQSGLGLEHEAWTTLRQADDALRRVPLAEQPPVALVRFFEGPARESEQAADRALEERAGQVLEPREVLALGEEALAHQGGAVEVAAILGSFGTEEQSLRLRLGLAEALAASDDVAGALQALDEVVRITEAGSALGHQARERASALRRERSVAQLADFPALNSARRALADGDWQRAAQLAELVADDASSEDERMAAEALGEQAREGARQEAGRRLDRAEELLAAGDVGAEFDGLVEDMTAAEDPAIADRASALIARADELRAPRQGNAAEALAEARSLRSAGQLREAVDILRTLSHTQAGAEAQLELDELVDEIVTTERGEAADRYLAARRLEGEERQAEMQAIAAILAELLNSFPDSRQRQQLEANLAAVERELEP